MIPYTKDRVVHGTALAQKQTIAFNIADMHMGIEAMRWMTWQAAWELEANRPATRSAQLAYTYGGSQTMTIADNGVQAMGGHGAAVGFGPEHHCHNLEGFHGKSAWGQRRCTVLLPRAQLLRAECMGTGKEGARVTAWLATGAAT